jgi:hypothetical protein
MHEIRANLRHANQHAFYLIRPAWTASERWSNNSPTGRCCISYGRIVASRTGPGAKRSSGMHWRDRRHRYLERASEVTWGPVLAVVATTLSIACLGSMCFLQLEQFGPEVGAMVVFKPGTQRMDLWHINASAVANAGPDPAADAITRACILRPSAMAEGGGSLVVEARRMSRPPIYLVHWVGSRTSDGSGDCGREADLVLSRTDLQKLANTAGGYGAGAKTIGP